MGMPIKTGAVVLLKEYGSWMFADIFQVTTQSDSGGIAHLAHVFVIKSAARPEYGECPYPITHECRVGHGFMHESKDKHGTIIVVSSINLKDMSEVKVRA
jgi:hypothetical protein